MYRIVLLLLAIMALPTTFAGPVYQPLKDGFYKIVNPEDGYVLTVTQEGRPGPRHVITDEWVGAPTQKWKVKTIQEGLQMIRNEEIKDNEVSKELNPHAIDGPSGKGEGPKFKQLEWNIVQHDDGYYELNNGWGCLHGHGKGNRIIVDEHCEVPHKWKLEFLSELRK